MPRIGSFHRNDVDIAKTSARGQSLELQLLYQALSSYAVTRFYQRCNSGVGITSHFPNTFAFRTNNPPCTSCHAVIARENDRDEKPLRHDTAAVIDQGSMSGDRRSYGTYSVFVGRLSRDTTQDELYELFKPCGPISGTYIADHVPGLYIYGFVRFTDPQAALTAVREVDQWTLKGWMLKVELASHTRRKLMAEGHLEDTRKPRAKHAPPTKQMEMTRMSMDSLLSESRLRDSCTEINLQTGMHSGNRLDVEKLMADINKQKCRKTCVLNGDLGGQHLKTISQIKKKLLKSEANGRIPAQTTSKFFKTLENILENVISIAQEDDELQSQSAPDSVTSEGASSQFRGGKQTTFVKHLSHAIRKTNGLSSNLEEKMAFVSNLNESQSVSNVSCSDRTCGLSSGEDERGNYMSETATKLEKRISSDQNEDGEIVSGDFTQSYAKQKQGCSLSEREGSLRNGVISVMRNHSNMQVQSLLQETGKSIVDDTKKSEGNDTPPNGVDDTINSVINNKRICSTGRGVLDAVMSDPSENTNFPHCSRSDEMSGSSSDDSSNSSFSSDSERNRLFLRFLGSERGHCLNADTSPSNQHTSENESSTSDVETMTNHNVCVEQRLMSKSDNCDKLKFKDSDYCTELTSILKNMLHIQNKDDNHTNALIDHNASDFHVDPELYQDSYSNLPECHQSPAAFRNSSMPTDKLKNTSSSISPNHSQARPCNTNGYKPPMGRGLSSILDKLRSRERRPGTCLPESDKHAQHNNSAECVDLSCSDHAYTDNPYDGSGGDALLSDSHKEVWTSNFVELREDKTVSGPVRQRNARPKARPQRVFGSSTQNQSLSEAESRFKPLKVLEEHNKPPIQSISCQPKDNLTSVLLSHRRSSAENHAVAKPMADAISILQGCSKSASSETESDIVAVDSGVESDSFQRIQSGRKRQEREFARPAANGGGSRDSDQMQLYIKQVVGRGRGLQARFQ
ncbi:serine-rich adhesin for platelets-like [Haliotis asinina]|uniref:serine-rich adhesin for platelets-like n=1 Tax=Haliotis asinina TaxID=109174 RepID=UPI0035320CA1